MKLTTTAAAWTVTGALGLAVVAGTVAAFADSPVPEPRPAVTVAGVPAPEEPPAEEPPAASGADTEDSRDDDADRDDDATQGQSDPTKPRPLASPVSPKSPVSAPSGD